MVDCVGLHRADQADVVGNPANVRYELAHLDARLAVGLKLVFGAEQRRIRIDERGPVALEEVGRRELAVVFRELRLPVEELEVARGPGLEHIHHPLRLGRVVRRLHGQGRRRREAGHRFPRGERSSGDARQADPAVAEKPAAREEPGPG